VMTNLKASIEKRLWVRIISERGKVHVGDMCHLV
jgi:hypothetical protein